MNLSPRLPRPVKVVISYYIGRSEELSFDSLSAALTILEARKVHIDDGIEYIFAECDGKAYGLVCDHCFEWEELDNDTAGT
jgi:hypothetical protein